MRDFRPICPRYVSLFSAFAALLLVISVALAQSGRLSGDERRQKRIEDYLGRYVDSSTGAVRHDLCQAGIEQMLQMRARSPLVEVSGLAVRAQWTQIGPAPLRIDRPFHVTTEGRQESILEIPVHVSPTHIARMS